MHTSFLIFHMSWLFQQHKPKHWFQRTQVAYLIERVQIHATCIEDVIMRMGRTFFLIGLRPGKKSRLRSSNAFLTHAASSFYNTNTNTLIEFLIQHDQTYLCVWKKSQFLHPRLTLKLLKVSTIFRRKKKVDQQQQ